MVTPEEARKLANLTQDDYCSCLPAYKDRGMFDPQCQSCMTHDERHECANALRDLATQVESLQADAARYRWLRDKCFYGRGDFLIAEVDWPYGTTKDAAVDAAREAK